MQRTINLLSIENIDRCSLVTEPKINIEEGAFKGFTADHLMAIFYNKEDEIVAISYLTENPQGQFSFFMPNEEKTGFEKHYIYKEEIENPFVFQMSYKLEDFSEKEEFERVVKEALEHPIYERAYLDKSIKLTDVYPGQRSNNGGEYGFYTHLEPTSIVGVFKMWTSCTCDFDLCGTDGSSENGSYVYISSDELDEMIEKSEEIENLGNRY